MGIVQAIIPRLQIDITISALVPFHNYAGLRGRTQTGRPYPAFNGMRKPSTYGFVSTDSGMLGGSRPGPVIRHGFEMAGWAEARPGPIMGPSPAEWPPSAWRAAPRKRKAADGGSRGLIRAPERRAAAHAGRAPRAFRALRTRSGAPGTSVIESFSKIVLASPCVFPYSTFLHGGVAQLGERLTGSQEVRGSIPLVSTRALNEAPTQVGAFFHIGTQGQRRQHDPPGRQDRKKLRRTRPL